MIEYTPSLDEFLKRADQGNLVPVYREILADLETPVSAFLKLREASNGYAFLLESVAGGESIARYSYLACNPHRLFSSKGRTVTVREGNGTVQEETLPEGRDPLHALKALMEEYKFVPLPGWERFPGGAVGYMGYDLVRFFEDLPEESPDDLELPDCQFMIADTIIIFDHVMHRARILANAHVGGTAPHPPAPSPQSGEGGKATSPPAPSPRVERGRAAEAPHPPIRRRRTGMRSRGLTRWSRRCASRCRRRCRRRARGACRRIRRRCRRR